MGSKGSLMSLLLGFTIGHFLWGLAVVLLLGEVPGFAWWVLLAAIGITYIAYGLVQEMEITNARD